jgi:hypothetical protein
MNQVDYSPENIPNLLELINQLGPQKAAEQLNTSRHSLVAKLSSLGHYKRKPYTNKRGELPKSKDDLVDEIAILCGQDPQLFESLGKANKSVLETIKYHLTH